jgi:cytidine deaminase
MSVETKTKDLSADRIRVLREQAAAAAKHAYAPYSNFCVGAAVLLDSGHTVTGCNVENVSYRLTVCAEQAAVARAVVEYGSHIRIMAVAVANADATKACQPCGACRQTLAEFATGDCRVFYPEKDGAAGECTLGELLPASFGKRSLREPAENGA